MYHILGPMRRLRPTGRVLAGMRGISDGAGLIAHAPLY